jgi:hypothetical protein
LPDTSSGEAQATWLAYPFLNVPRALARSKLDDARVREPALFLPEITKLPAA